MIAAGAGAMQAVRSLVAGVGRPLVFTWRRAVWAWLGGRRRLTAIDIESALSGGGPVGVMLAIGEPAQGIDGWRLTPRQAQAALLVALRTPQAAAADAVRRCRAARISAAGRGAGEVS